jgi:hypothetical protein
MILLIRYNYNAAIIAIYDWCMTRSLVRGSAEHAELVAATTLLTSFSAWCAYALSQP